MAFDPNDSASNEVHQLDEVNDRLYRRDLAGKKPRRIDSLHPRTFAVKKEWVEKAEAAKTNATVIASHPSFFRKFFFFALGFAALSILIVAVTFFTGSNTVSNNNIELNVLGNSFTAGGAPLPLQLEVVNKNSSELDGADLIVNYSGAGDASGSAAPVSDLESLGTIGAGKTVDKSVSITLFGTEGSTQDVNLTLQYRLNGSNAVFVKQSTFPVTISSSPVSLLVDAPSSVTPNQEMTFTVKTISNSSNTLSNMLLNVVYPPGFQFATSSPTADSNDNTWKLGDLAPGAERDITITGTLFGTEGDDQDFHIYTGAASPTNNVQIGVSYNSLLQAVSLVQPFVSADLSINGSDAETTPISSSTPATGEITYTNNLTTPVTDASITVKLSGNALDTSSVTPADGFYDSSKNTITWDATTLPALASLAPGASGTLEFTFASLPLVSDGSTLSSPSINLSVSIQGQQSGAASGAPSQVTNFETRTAVVSSDLGFTSAASYGTGPFTNTGPVPPVANEPTTYTITWGVTNSANMLTDGTVTTTLPDYVDWVGTISPADEPIAYDSANRTVTWSVGQIPAGTGVTTTAHTVSFQVRLNASTSQVDSAPSLTLGTNVSALDNFTGQTLTLSRDGLTTDLTATEGLSGTVSQ